MKGRYAVIGNPIVQSKSPAIHAAFAEQTGQDLEYVALEAPVDGFAGAVDAFRRAGGRGLNVTAPFKLDAFRYATTLRQRALLAGAVNAMAFDGEMVEADNFDGLGLVRDIQQNLGVELRGKRVLLLGAGGATRGAILPFLEAGSAELMIVNRDVAKARALGEEFTPPGALVTKGYDEVAAETGRFEIVVNATSASLQGELPPIRASLFGRDCLAYELAYGKGLTPFLRLARDAGVTRLHDGVGMLVEQAAEAFAWWRGVRPATQSVIARMTVPLT